MKNLIHPLLKEGYISRKLQNETQKRIIPLMPVDGLKMPIYLRLFLELKVFIKKRLKQL
jgi:hypothetical protein